MNYALGYAFNLTDIFYNFKSSKLKIDCTSLTRLYNEPHKKKLAIRMFRDCCKLVINDIIENDVDFQLPTGSRKCSLRMHAIKDDNFKIARQNGAFKDVDFLSSMFAGHQITFFMYGYNRTIRTKRVYVSPKLRDRITELTNEGKSYAGMNVKTINDYYNSIQNLYPWIPIQDIKKILNFGWKSFYLHNSYGGDVLIRDNEFWMYVGYIYKDSIKHYDYYVRKLCLKLRITAQRKDVPWDGYYYFCLTDKQYASYLKQKNGRGRPRKYYTFGKVKFFKLLDECKVNGHALKYIFKTTFNADFGYSYYIENFKSDKFELILEREPQKLKDILIDNNDYEIL